MPDGLGEYLVVRSSEETGGEYVGMEWTLPPGAFAPPVHRHPTLAQEYEVLEGSFEVMVDFVSSKRFNGLKRPSTAIVMAMAWREHADLVVPSSRPLRWGMAGLARLGGLLGYRA